jgi:hypothetical protein
MTFTRLLLTAALSAAPGACVVGYSEGQAYSQSQRNSYAGFSRLEVSADVDVVLAQGPFDVLAETTGEANFDTLIVEVKGDSLHIGRRPSQAMGERTPRLRVTVSAPALSAISVSGEADVSAAALKAERLKLTASGGADIEMSGARIGVLEASASGGGDISADALTCDSVTAEATGGGDIDISVGATAHGKASGGGDVRFLGSPTTYSRDVSGGGDVSLTAR